MKTKVTTDICSCEYICVWLTMKMHLLSLVPSKNFPV